MSLILDALNRADTERKNQAPLPDLNTRHSPLALEPDPKAPGWRWWILALVIILGLMLVVWRWFGARDLSPLAAAPGQENLIPAVSAPVVPVTPPPVATVDTTQAKPVAPARPISSLAAVGAASAAVTPNDVQNLYAEEAPATAVADADINQLYAAEESTGSASIVDPFAVPSAPDIAPLTTEIEREPPRTFANSPAQDFNDLPWNSKQKMPTISYQRHDYLPGGISSVVINGQTLGVGNIAATGQFIVQDILVDGVVLKHGDRVFKLRALNGWINM